jgi:hypothetical protein
MRAKHLILLAAFVMPVFTGCSSLEDDVQEGFEIYKATEHDGRTDGIHGVWWIASRAPAVVSILVQRLGDKDPQIRRCSLKAIMVIRGYPMDRVKAVTGNETEEELASLRKRYEADRPAEHKESGHPSPSVKQIKALLMLNALQSILGLDDAIIDMQEKIRANAPLKADVSRSLKYRLEGRRIIRNMYYALDYSESKEDLEACIEKWKLEDLKSKLVKEYFDSQQD